MVARYARGVSYPFQQSPTGGVLMVEDDAVLRASVLSILITKPTERPFDVKDGVPFGTRLAVMNFDSIEHMRDIVSYDLRRSISVWEPRVSYRSVIFENMPGESRGIYAEVSYIILATNLPDVAGIHTGRRFS